MRLILVMAFFALSQCQDPDVSDDFTPPAGQYCYVLSTLPVMALPLTSTASQALPAATTSTSVPSHTSTPSSLSTSSTVLFVAPAQSETSAVISSVTSSVVTPTTLSFPQTLVSGTSGLGTTIRNSATSPAQTSNSLPVQTLSSSSNHLRPLSIFLFLSTLFSRVHGYVTTVGNIVYSCTNSGIVAVPTSSTSTSIRSPTSSASSTATSDQPEQGSSSSESSGTNSCIDNLDCPEAYLGLQYCSAGICKSGECNNDSNCPRNGQCVNHLCF